jgi:hypothetical protein
LCIIKRDASRETLDKSSNNLIINTILNQKTGRYMKDYYKKFLSILLLCIVITGCGKKEITITTEPDHADVYLESSHIGTTPLTINTQTKGNEIFSSPRASFTLKIHKDFYEQVNRTITFSGDKIKNLHIALSISKEPLPGYNGIFKNNHTLTHSDVSNLSRAELTLLLEEIYARYGKGFHEAETSTYFKGKNWYKENPYYDTSFLTPVDRENINFINKQIGAFAHHGDITEMLGIGKPTSSDLSLTETILHNREYTYTNYQQYAAQIDREYDSEEEKNDSLEEETRDTCILIFEPDMTLQWHDDSDYFGTYYAEIDSRLQWNWQVYRGRVYVWDIHDDESGCILFIFTLDHDTQEITTIPEIDGRIWK